MNRIVSFLLLSITVFSFSCNHAKEKAKEAINKTGETVGKGVSEFADGVKEGVTKTFDCKVLLSNELNSKGVSAGKFSIESDSTNDNKLVVYLIFDKDINQPIKAKVFDVDNKEYGRTSVAVTGKAGEARFIDFVFDQRTDIETRSKIVLE